MGMSMYDLVYLMGKSGHKVLAMGAHLVLKEKVRNLYRWNRWHIALFSNGVDFIYPVRGGCETLIMLRSENERWYQFLTSLGVEPYEVPNDDPSAVSLVQDATGYIETEERKIGTVILGEVPETVLFVFSFTDQLEVTGNFRLGVAIEPVGDKLRVIQPVTDEHTAKDHYGAWASRRLVNKSRVKLQRGKRR
jgi:hypothetical protein